MALERVRINASISKELNDWLDAKSRKSGIPKSTLVHLALEQYMMQQESLHRLPEFMNQLEELKKAAIKLELVGVTKKDS